MLHPAHDHQPVAVMVDPLGHDSQRDEQVSFKAVGHPGSQHANDGIRFAVQPHLLADDAEVAAETFLPQPMGHDDHVISTWLSFLGQKISPQQQRDSLQVEEARRGYPRLHRLGVASYGQTEGAFAPGDHILKDRVLAFPVQVIASGNGIVVAVDFRPHHDQLVGIWIRQGRKERGIDDAEDGSIGADSED